IVVEGPSRAWSKKFSSTETKQFNNVALTTCDPFISVWCYESLIERNSHFSAHNFEQYTHPVMIIQSLEPSHQIGEGARSHPNALPFSQIKVEQNIAVGIGRLD